MGDLCSCSERWSLPFLFKSSMSRSPQGHFSFPIYKSAESIVTCPCKHIWGGLSRIYFVLRKDAEVQWAIGGSLGQGPGPGASGPCRFHWLSKARGVSGLSHPTVKTCLCAPRGERKSREGVGQNLPFTEIIRKKKLTALKTSIQLPPS